MPENSKRPESGEPRPRRILVVEDNEGLNNLAQKSVRDAGYEVTGATNGSDAIEHVMANPEVVMLLDIRLPDMTGSEIISTLNECNRPVPFIVMTGHGDERTAVEMMKLGASDYLVKGLDLTDRLPGAFQRLFRELDTEQRLHNAEQSLRESYQELQLMDEINRGAMEGEHYDEINEKVVHAFAEICNTKMLTVYNYDETVHRLVPQNSGVNEAIAKKIKKLTGVNFLNFAPILKDGYRIAESLKTGKSFVVSNADEIAALWGEFTESQTLRAFIKPTMRLIKPASIGVVPLVTSTGPIGLITFITGTSILQSDLERIMRFGHQAAAIMAKLRVEKQLHIAKNHLGVVASIGNMANSSLDLDEVLGRILRGTLKATGASVGMIFLRDPETGCLELGTSTGLSEAFVESYRLRTIQPGEGLTGQIAQSGEPIYIMEDSSHDERITRSIIEAEGLNTFIGVPVRAKDEIVAVMNIVTRPPDILTKMATSLIYAIGTGVGFAIHNAQLFKERKQAEEALRESEERYHTLFELSPDAIVTHDGRNVLIANPAAADLLGLDDPAELVGKSVIDIVHPDHRKMAGERIRQIFKRGKVAGLMEEKFLSADSGIVDVEVAASTIISGGKPAILLIARNIAERKQAEADRRMRETHLRQQQRLESIGTLASGVAHEINNPISGILSYAELIGMKLQEDSPLREYTAEIARESGRVAAIVRNLLTFSRNEKETHSPAVIADVVNETLSLVQAVLRHDQITLERDIPDDLPKIICRSQQIQQVLMNLMTNARDALNERYPEYDENKKLIVQVRPFEKEGIDWIRLTIEDHGAGIPDEVRDRIFDPFFTTKDRTKGTGLGLSVSYGIVKDHHGKISVESEPGQNTRFHVDLRADNGWVLAEPDKETSIGGN